MKESCCCCGHLQGGDEEKLLFLWRVFDTMKRAEVWKLMTSLTTVRESKHRIEEAEQTINTEVKKRWKLINKIRRIQGVQQFKKQIKLNQARCDARDGLV